MQFNTPHYNNNKSLAQHLFTLMRGSFLFVFLIPKSLYPSDFGNMSSPFTFVNFFTIMCRLIYYVNNPDERSSKIVIVKLNSSYNSKKKSKLEVSSRKNLLLTFFGLMPTNVCLLIKCLRSVICCSSVFGECSQLHYSFRITRGVKAPVLIVMVLIGFNKEIFVLLTNNVGYLIPS